MRPLRAANGARPAPPADDVLGRWVAAARASFEPCVVLDTDGAVAGLSAAAATLLGRSDDEVVGRGLLEGLLDLVDFSARDPSGSRLPPIVAAQQDHLSRGVMQVRLPDGTRITLDAISAPLHDDEHHLVGSVSFLHAV